MRPTLKEYRSVLAAVTVSLLCAAGSGAFVWSAAQERADAVELLKKRSAEINKFRNATPPPTKEHSKQLQGQLDAAERAYRGLRGAIVNGDKLPLRPVSPQEFQKDLNEKAQALSKKAEAAAVKLESADTESAPDSFFYLSFKDFKTKPPSPEKAPSLNRQLLASELLLTLLLENHPLSIRKVRLFEPDAPKPLPVPVATKGGKPEPKSPPKPPTFAVQCFDIHFSARAENLRDFLNALSAEKRAFFVARNLKVTNSKEKEAPKKGELASPTTQSGPGTAENNENAARYVLGDEFVDVELTLDMLTLAPEAAEPPSKETAKDTPKRS